MKRPLSSVSDRVFEIIEIYARTSEQFDFVLEEAEMNSCRRILLVVVVGASLLAVDRQAQAQAYPSKPIRLVVNFAGTELISRILGAKLSPALGEQIVIDPRFGAGGNIGVVTEQQMQR